MTVQKDVTKNIYVGNGSTRTFPFTFECPAEHPEYIKVYLMQDDGTALATSDYQLDMDARQITYPSIGAALPEGKKLVIMRELPLQQMMNLVNNGPYFAEDVELAFDENVMAMQQIAEKLNRSIIMSVDIDGDAFVNEVPFEAGKSFRIADDGKSIVLTEDPARVLPLVQEAYAQAQAQAQSAYASAVAAAKSEDSAAASASEADNSAQSASVSAASAVESARLAEGYKTAAETAKSNASLYAANAKTSADNATASKEAAQSAATTASNFASAARNSAGEAKTYKDNAKTYMDNAKNYSENVNVFVPSVSSDGVLSWTNKAGLVNPASVNIKGVKGDKGDKGDTGATGASGAAATISIGSVYTGEPGTNASVTNSGTSTNAILNFQIPRGTPGADGGVTVDEELSSTSTNPVQNKAIYNALLNKVGTDIFSGFALMGATAPIRWRQGSQVVGSLTASNYTGTALRATQDSDGNIINTTYAKKSDISGMVKSVNNIKPDSNGNVSITVSGGGTNVTVDTALSATSTNPVQNRVIKEALDGKLSKTEIAAAALKDGAGNTISTTYAKKTDMEVELNNKLGKTDNAASATIATKASQDSDGNIISTTYAKKTDVSGVVKSVNGTKPDASGNVTVAVSGGGGVSTSVANNWTAQQTFQRLKFNFESFATSRISGTYDIPSTSVATYNVTGALTLDMSTLAGMISNGDTSIFTAYIASNGSYALSITNAGTLKYAGSAADLAITASGLLLNVFLTKNSSGVMTSIAQATKLS